MKQKDMKQKWCLALILSSGSMILSAQQSAISSAGGLFKNISGSVSFTVGESFLSTFTSTNLTLSPGIFYLDPGSTGTKSKLTSNFEISVSPNPANEYVTITSEKKEELFYVLYDLNGKILEEEEITGTETRISLKSLSPSVYFIKVLQNSSEVKYFKIIKL